MNNHYIFISPAYHLTTAGFNHFFAGFAKSQNRHLHKFNFETEEILKLLYPLKLKGKVWLTIPAFRES